jgi:hypothetical protein
MPDQHQLESAIRRLIDQVRAKRDLIGASLGDTMKRDAALAADALPVEADLGGVLLVTPELQVVEYALFSGTISPVIDAQERLYAFKCAAEQFPELADLMPARPAGALDCPACEGVGLLAQRFRCGQCHSLGWVTP